MLKLLPLFLLSACAGINPHPYPCEVGIGGEYNTYLNDNNSTCLYGFDQDMKFVLVMLERSSVLLKHDFNKTDTDFNVIFVIDKNNKLSYSLVENNSKFDCGEDSIDVDWKSSQAPTEFNVNTICNNKQINLNVFYYYSYNPDWN